MTSVKRNQFSFSKDTIKFLLYLAIVFGWGNFLVFELRIHSNTFINLFICKCNICITRDLLMDFDIGQGLPPLSCDCIRYYL